MKNNWMSLFAIVGILLLGTITGAQLTFADKDDRPEVEIEIEDGIAEVKVETEDNKYEFELGTTDIEEIIEIIELRTGLSKDIIRQVMDVEIEKNSDSYSRDDSDDTSRDNDDSSDDMNGDAEQKVRASITGDQSEVKIELEFVTDARNTDKIISEILDKFEITIEQAEKLLKIQDDDDDRPEEKFKVEIETEDGVTEVEVELRYVLDTTDKNAILDSIVAQSQLTREQVSNSIVLKDDRDDKESDQDSFDETSGSDKPISNQSDVQDDSLREENERLRQENQMLRDEIEQLKKRLVDLNDVIMEQIRVMMDTLSSLKS